MLENRGLEIPMKNPFLPEGIASFYVLEGRVPRPTEDMNEWAAFFESDSRRVAETETELYRVSTVFLGLPHGVHRSGAPCLFETMVFTSEAYHELVGAEESRDGEMHRYATWDDAEIGHRTQVRRLERQIESLLAEGRDTVQNMLQAAIKPQ